MLTYNDDWLNRSANRNDRNSSPETTGKIEFVVWHGTDSPNPTDTPATLNWALINDGKRGAANYYIGQSGLVYRYIDPEKYIAWHAGAGGAHARGYTGFQVNVHAIGIEIEERITKQPFIPPTSLSLESAAQLAVVVNKLYGIPLERAYHVGHREIVAPGYRFDPGHYSIDSILLRANQIMNAPLTVHPSFQNAWNLSGGVWKKNQLTPGFPLAPAAMVGDHLMQRFERGTARLEADGSVSWLLLSEITPGT